MKTVGKLLVVVGIILIAFGTTGCKWAKFGKGGTNIKEVYIDRIVEVEKIVEVPVIEYVDRDVEVEVEVCNDACEALQQQLDEANSLTAMSVEKAVQTNQWSSRGGLVISEVKVSVKFASSSILIAGITLMPNQDLLKIVNSWCSCSANGPEFLHTGTGGWYNQLVVFTFQLEHDPTLDVSDIGLYKVSPL